MYNPLYVSPRPPLNIVRLTSYVGRIVPYSQFSEVYGLTLLWTFSNLGSKDDTQRLPSSFGVSSLVLFRFCVGLTFISSQNLESVQSLLSRYWVHLFLTLPSTFSKDSF